MTRRSLALIPLLLLAACTPPKPPIYVMTSDAASGLATVREGRFDLRPVAKVDLHDFKRAFVKRYESEEAFLKGFHADLGARINEGVKADATTFTVELPSLDVGSHSVGHWVTTGGGGPHMPPQQHYESTEYCDITLAFQVKDANGATLLSGAVKESTSKGEFLHPNQSKLSNAVQGVQQHLVEYLRGRMSAENIGLPPVAGK